MTIYINEVQLYCSHEEDDGSVLCDQSVTLRPKECAVVLNDGHEHVYRAFIDQAFDIGWIVATFGGKVFCPNHDDGEMI